MSTKKVIVIRFTHNTLPLSTKTFLLIYSMTTTTTTTIMLLIGILFYVSDGSHWLLCLAGKK
ncbi:hypothetical protein DERP_008206 [Dermatophagoides pteronyssinus]|uniref:Transmembrane protein n=1 Tax=Dermatophagoides pteronyssinus TaxID=6956 RepID=A0ABQ8JK50_DERPT|nr:hypothetical protein DERP_008206 [Dermatophagoides pteronyssinus]